MLLLQHNADVNVINGEGQTPRDVSKHEDVTKLLQAAERTEARQKEERLLAAAREGDLDTLKILASGPCRHREQESCRMVGSMHSKSLSMWVLVNFASTYLNIYLRNRQNLFKKCCMVFVTIS